MAANSKEIIEAIENNISRVIVGRKETIRLVVAALVAGGHVLLEDVPGTGKTMLAKALARSIDVDFARIQFTPDLLPSDVTGLDVFQQKSGDFVFRRGPVFTNVLLADEINRATPRTQAGLLECMEERQVTVDGVTRPLPEPFFVIATQNPVETAGTFPLPEAQMDRFMVKLSMGLPDRDEEIAILHRFITENGQQAGDHKTAEGHPRTKEHDVAAGVAAGRQMRGEQAGSNKTAEEYNLAESHDMAADGMPAGQYMQDEREVLGRLHRVASAEDILTARATAAAVRIPDPVAGYLADVVVRTRARKDLVAGCSPRGTLAAARIAQVLALVDGRDYVVPEDIKEAVVPTLAHRLHAAHTYGAAVNTAKIMEEILAEVPVPTENFHG